MQSANVEDTIPLLSAYPYGHTTDPLLAQPNADSMSPDDVLDDPNGLYLLAQEGEPYQTVDLSLIDSMAPPGITVQLNASPAYPEIDRLNQNRLHSPFGQRRFPVHSPFLTAQATTGPPVPSVESAPPVVNENPFEESDGFDWELFVVDNIQATVSNEEWLRQHNTPRLNVPQLNVPQFDVPRLDAPQLDVPQLTIPQFEAAQLNVPRFDASQLDIPMRDVAQDDIPPTDGNVQYDELDRMFYEQFRKNVSAHPGRRFPFGNFFGLHFWETPGQWEEFRRSWVKEFDHCWELAQQLAQTDVTKLRRQPIQLWDSVLSLLGFDLSLRTQFWKLVSAGIGGPSHGDHVFENAFRTTQACLATQILRSASWRSLMSWLGNNVPSGEVHPDPELVARVRVNAIGIVISEQRELKKLLRLKCDQVEIACRINEESQAAKGTSATEAYLHVDETGLAAPHFPPCDQARSGNT